MHVWCTWGIAEYDQSIIKVYHGKGSGQRQKRSPAFVGLVKDLDIVSVTVLLIWRDIMTNATLLAEASCSFPAAQTLK